MELRVFGHGIRFLDLRRRRKVTRRAVARRLHVDEQTVLFWETDQHSPTIRDATRYVGAVIAAEKERKAAEA